MPLKKSLSVAIVACNEAQFLQQTLRSVAWATEIVLIDSGSTDDTIEIAEQCCARVYYRDWQGYGAQVNFALQKCTSDWILNLDADEVVSDELALEIQNLLSKEPDFNAYMVPRLNQIFGRWMRHGGLYPDRKLRLFQKGVATLREDTEPHATPKSSEQQGRLKGDLHHYQYPTLTLYLEHMNRYSSASVPLVLRKRKTRMSAVSLIANAILNPVATFTYNYFFRLGFLDGKEGLLFHLYHSLYVHWKYVKAWLAAEGKTQS